ncbi:MAG: hypothetical protein U0136_02040 [Bdellovibrionota bacterium]
MTKKEAKIPPLEEGLLRAMQALDNQIARAMERTPAEREAHGVQKWEPITERIERVCVFLMNALGDDEVKLDSLVILSQAFAKALTLVTDDLGEEGLGKLRTAYCLNAFEQIAADAERGRAALKHDAELM